MNDAARKELFRLIPYALYGVTAQQNGEDHGMLANWVSQASFAPPMVSVAVENASKTMPLIREVRAFGLNLLAAGQRGLAGKLARPSSKVAHKLKGIKTKPGPIYQTPILVEALGWFECRLVGTLPAGDHTLVLGEVVEAAVEQEGAILTLEASKFQYSE